MSGEMIRVPYRELDEFTESVLTKLGISPEDVLPSVEAGPELSSARRHEWRLVGITGPQPTP